MSPEEAINYLRQHALELMDIYSTMSVNKNISSYEYSVLMTFCLYLIEQLAENRWFASDIIEKYESGTPPVFMFNNQTKQISKLDLSEPPFEKDFFSKNN